MYELTRNEELILLSIWKLKDNAYGVTIRDDFKTVTGKALNYGSPLQHPIPPDSEGLCEDE
jgi:hypothetical protein